MTDESASAGVGELDKLEQELDDVRELDARVAELVARVQSAPEVSEELRGVAIAVALEVGSNYAAQSLAKGYLDADFVGVLRGLRSTLLDRRQGALDEASDEGLAWLVSSWLDRRDRESGTPAAVSLLKAAGSCGFGDNETLDRTVSALAETGLAAIVGQGNDKKVALTSSGRERIRRQRYASAKRTVIESFESVSRGGDEGAATSDSPKFAGSRRVVVLTALDVEFEAVHRLLGSVRRERHPNGTIYEVGQYKDWDVAVVETGAGQLRASVETERASQHFSPELIVFLGVAGGIKDVSVGDVVVATKVYGYESGKDEAEFQSRPDGGEPSYPTLQAARAVARDFRKERSEFQVFIKPIAAGEKVVASKASETAKLIRQRYGDAVAVEMEGRGFLLAASARVGVNFAVIRGISNLLDGKAESDAAGSQEQASANAASVLVRIFDEIGPSEA